jgi:phosphatidylinositol-3-phosphatase
LRVTPPDLSSARCILHVRPYAELAQDLRTGAVARYNFIVPNLCDSGHDSCAPLHDRIRQEDAFLARELPVLMASPAYQDGGLILITWDEGAGGDEPIGLIAVSPFAKPGYRGDLAYSHASTLRTIEEIFALTPLLRGAATAASLADLFTAYP